MSQRNDTYRTVWSRARVQQAALGGPGSGGASVRGLLLRGVVIKEYDDDGQPYCDAMVYSGLRGAKWGILPRILVTFDTGGTHDGSTRLPKAATKDLSTGQPIDVAYPTSPADMDGDHILIGFLDDDVNFPTLLRYLRHPRADIGNTNRDLGPRLVPRSDEARTDFRKFNGTAHGVDEAGNHVIDVRFGRTEDQVSPKGEEGRWSSEEPQSVESRYVEEEDGSSAIVKLRYGAQHKVVLSQDASEQEQVVVSTTKDGIVSSKDSYGDVSNQVSVQGFGTEATLELGSAAESAAVASAVQAVLYLVLPLIQNHVHPVSGTTAAVSPSLVTIANPPELGGPDLDAIVSDKLKFPTNG